MSQILNVHRIGTDWAARDVTGAEYGQSPDIYEAIAAAERLAKRLGAKVVLSSEAQNHLCLDKSQKPKA